MTMAEVTSEPEALLAVLKNPAYHFKRIGLEAGPLSLWLFSALADAELPVVCVATPHNAGGVEGADQQDEPQRCTRHRADDAGGALPPGAREDATQSETATIAIENDLRGTLRHPRRDHARTGSAGAPVTPARQPK
jgi:transposase